MENLTIPCKTPETGGRSGRMGHLAIKKKVLHPTLQRLENATQNDVINLCNDGSLIITPITDSQREQLLPILRSAYTYLQGADLTLKVGSKLYHLNSSALASVSERFRALVAAAKAANQETPNLTLPDLSQIEMDALLLWLGGEPIQIPASSEELNHLVILAKFAQRYQIHSLLNSCEEVLESLFTNNNHIRIVEAPDQLLKELATLKTPRLIKQLTRCIAHNFFSEDLIEYTEHEVQPSLLASSTFPRPTEALLNDQTFWKRRKKHITPDSKSYAHTIRQWTNLLRSKREISQEEIRQLFPEDPMAFFIYLVNHQSSINDSILLPSVLNGLCELFFRGELTHEDALWLWKIGLQNPEWMKVIQHAHLTVITKASGDAPPSSQIFPMGRYSRFALMLFSPKIYEEIVNTDRESYSAYNLPTPAFLKAYQTMIQPCCSSLHAWTIDQIESVMNVCRILECKDELHPVETALLGTLNETSIVQLLQIGLRFKMQSLCASCIRYVEDSTHAKITLSPFETYTVDIPLEINNSDLLVAAIDLLRPQIRSLKVNECSTVPKPEKPPKQRTFRTLTDITQDERLFATVYHIIKFIELSALVQGGRSLGNDLFTSSYATVPITTVSYSLQILFGLSILTYIWSRYRFLIIEPRPKPLLIDQNNLEAIAPIHPPEDLNPLLSFLSSNLIELDLSDASGALTNAHIQWISQCCPNLEFLCLPKVCLCDAEGWQFLARFTKLSKLHVHLGPWSAHSLMSLNLKELRPYCNELTSLRITSHPDESPRRWINRERYALDFLQNVPDLTEVTMVLNQVDSIGHKRFSELTNACPNITSLQTENPVAHIQLSPKKGQKLVRSCQKLKNLACIRFTGSNALPSTFLGQELRQLESVQIQRVASTQEITHLLTHCPNLVELILGSQCKIDSSIAQACVQHRSLQHLEIHNASELADSGATALINRSFQGFKISHFPDVSQPLRHRLIQHCFQTGPHTVESLTNSLVDALLNVFRNQLPLTAATDLLFENILTQPQLLASYIQHSIQHMRVTDEAQQVELNKIITSVCQLFQVEKPGPQTTIMNPSLSRLFLLLPSFSRVWSSKQVAEMIHTYSNSLTKKRFRTDLQVYISSIHAILSKLEDAYNVYLINHHPEIEINCKQTSLITESWINSLQEQGKTLQEGHLNWLVKQLAEDPPSSNPENNLLFLNLLEFINSALSLLIKECDERQLNGSHRLAQVLAVLTHPSVRDSIQKYLPFHTG